jgi:radical SAM protein with 4Fe4S-binding SPASM domain
MTEIKLGSYILFKDQMHMTPQGGVLFPPNMGREDYTGLSDADFDLDGVKMGQWGKVNIGGVHILKRCDGSHTVDDIIKELYADTYEESVEPVLTYLEMATNKFNIDVRDNPFKGETHITGSLDYFHPLRMLFEITTKCHSTCNHRGASGIPSAGHDVPTEEFLSLLERLHNHGTRDIELAGGEPLLHPDFQEIFDFCVGTFEKVVVTTDGLLVDEDIVKKFAYHTNVVVQIRVDSLTPGHYDKKQVNRAREKTIQACQLLVLYGIPRCIMITIGRDNIDHIEDILQLSCELGIRRKINYDFVQAIYARDTVSPYDILAWKQKIDKLESGEYEGRLTLFYERERTEYSNTCGAGTTMVTMDPHGDVRPCTYLPAEYITGGNLFESDFPSIFQSPMSEQLKTLEFPGGDTCKDCEFFHHCKGCFCDGVLMYEDIREKCMWGASHNLEEWINFL